MSTIARKVPGFFALALALSLALPASAGEAEDFVKGKLTGLSALVSQPKSAENDKKVLAAFEVFDYEGLAKATLRDTWDQRSPAERAEFSDVLKVLVQNAYRKNIKKTAGYSVEYLGEQEGDAGRVVRTIASHKNAGDADKVSIDYVVHPVAGNWKVFDIVTEGSSLVRNYRNQFTKVIKKDGFEGLLKRMKAKRDKGGDVD